MFNKFKQKIADGVEGVSAGRQTPLSRTHKDTETANAGSLQVQNDSRIEKNENLDTCADASHLQNSSFSHPLEETFMNSTPLEITQEDEPQRSSSSLGHQSNFRKRRGSNSSTRSSSSVQDERGYVDSDVEAGMRTDTMSVNELRETYVKQDKSLRRYKQKFSELVDAYKGLQKDKEKLEGTLTNGQDKQMRKIKELRETLELEQQSKRHLEEALRMELGEKDDQIDVLKTQVNLLKTRHGLPSPVKDGRSNASSLAGSEFDAEMIQSLQDKVRLLNAEIETLTSDNEQAHAIVLRSEQEKKTAIESVMNNMHELLNEQEDLHSQVNILRDELKDRDITIMNMRSNEESSADRLRNEFMEEMKETVLAQSLKQQESELHMIFEEKEAQLKNVFADRVHELQRVMDENENQKLQSLNQKDSDITKKVDEIVVLEEQLNEWKDKEAKLKTKLQKLISEKEAFDKRFSQCQQQLEQEKEKHAGLEKKQHEKQDEWNEQISKVRRSSQDQLRKKTSELNEVAEKHKIELDTKLKESSQVMQAEHVKASRKLEVKISDMKKVVKELRQKISEKECKCSELESNLQDAKTEADQAKSINTSLAESEEKVGQLSCNMEVMVEEVEEWKNKYEILYASYNELSSENKGLEDQLTEKDLCIKELVNKFNNMSNNDDKFHTVCNELDEEKKKCEQLTTERDSMHLEMQQMLSTAKEEENALQSELNNLKTKLSYVEDELQELTQQLHNKVSEIELLVGNLDNVNNELILKDSNLEEKRKSFEELKEMYNSLTEEKQQLDYKHNEAIFELEESKSVSESKLKEEYESKLQEKDEELKNKLNILLSDKDSSVEEVTSKLEDMHKQKLTQMKNQYEEQLNKIENDLKLQLDAVENKHKEFVVQNEEEKVKLVADGEQMVQKIENDLLSTIQGNEKQLSEKDSLIQKLEASLCTKEDIAVEELQTKENTLRLHINELILKHKEDIEKMDSSYKEKLISVNNNYQLTINDYKRQIETTENRKCDDFNELTSKHTEDKNILLEQIEDRTVILNELKLLCQQKDKEYTLLSEKLDEECKQHGSLLQTKLSQQEITWKDKQQNLEKKFKKIINDRDKKNKTLADEVKERHLEELTSLQGAIASKENEFASQLTENVNQVSISKQKVEEGSIRLKDASERYENELCSLRSRENEAWSQLEQCKADYLISKDNYENKLVTFQTKSLEDKSNIEKLNLKVMSCQSNSTEIDTKFSELLIEKNKLEQKVINSEQIYEDKIRHLENKNNSLKDTYDENIRKLEDEVVEKTKCFEEQKCEILSKQSEAEEANNSKLVDLKKKAEMKISKLKKESSEKVNFLDSTKTDLEEKITMLEAHLEEQQILHEEQMMNSKEYEKSLSNNLQEYQDSMKSVSEKLNAEILTIKEQLNIKCEKVTELEELLDNATVDKMDALKMQQTHLDDERNVEVRKINEENKKQMDTMERKLTAKIDEKDFQHNSELKAMLKQFQSQLGGKDMEIQQAIQEASEVAQRDERQIISEYDQQIIELQKELRLREQDMLALQNETQQQFDQLHEEREIADKEHREEFGKLEVDYHKRLEDLSKRHEEALQNITSNKNTSLEEEKAKINEHLNEVEQKYISKIQELEDNHRSEMFTQEKKYKTQLKQSKIDMRKILANKGVIMHNLTSDHDNLSVLTNSNTSSDNEMDQAETIKLNAEQAPSTPKINVNDRPATLQLTDNCKDSVHSPGKSPQPLEFEYLRNILYNYMMGKQRKQMAKVLTAICHFTPSQVQQVLANVEEQESHTEKKSGFWM